MVSVSTTNASPAVCVHFEPEAEHLSSTLALDLPHTLCPRIIFSLSMDFEVWTLRVLSLVLRVLVRILCGCSSTVKII